jgi:hypothetical protein
MGKCFFIFTFEKQYKKIARQKFSSPEIFCLIARYFFGVLETF